MGSYVLENTVNYENMIRGIETSWETTVLKLKVHKTWVCVN
jgi:hypothetical protein